MLFICLTVSPRFRCKTSMVWRYVATPGMNSTLPHAWLYFISSKPRFAVTSQPANCSLWFALPARFVNWGLTLDSRARVNLDLPLCRYQQTGLRQTKGERQQSQHAREGGREKKKVCDP